MLAEDAASAAGGEAAAAGEGRGGAAASRSPARGAAGAGPSPGAAGAPGAAAAEGQPSEEPLEPLPRSPPQPVLPALQEPGNQEEGLPVFGPPTPAWLRPRAPAAIPAESGRADGVVALEHDVHPRRP